MERAAPPEHNVTDQDFADRRHLRYAGPIVDAHAHVMRTRPTDHKDDAHWAIADAETMLAVAAEFGVVQTYSMCPPEVIPALRQRFGDLCIPKTSSADRIDAKEPVSGALRRGSSQPGWRAGVARSGGRSSWRTRCRCGDKHSFGLGRRAVKRLNGPLAKIPQAPSAWVIAVGLSKLTLRPWMQGP
jgi:hypothetical protein